MKIDEEVLGVAKFTLFIAAVMVGIFLFFVAVDALAEEDAPEMRLHEGPQDSTPDIEQPVWWKMETV